MMHFPPLPGTPLYDAKGGMQESIAQRAKSAVFASLADSIGFRSDNRRSCGIFKLDTWNAVDTDRVKRFMDKGVRLR